MQVIFCYTCNHHRHGADVDNETDDNSVESNHDNDHPHPGNVSGNQENHDSSVPPYFPKELCSSIENNLSYDFNRRLFDIPTTINYDLLTDEQLSQPMNLETFQQVEDLITNFLSHFKPKSDDEIESEEDQIDKKELFLRSGKLKK